MRDRSKLIRPIAVLISIVAFGLVLFHAQSTASADAYSWTSGTLSAEAREDNGHTLFGQCTPEHVTYSTYFYVHNPTADACVFTAKSFRYAIFNTDWVSGLFVSIGSDQKMYHVDNIGFASGNGVRPSPNTDDFVYGSLIWRDLPSKLTRVVGSSGQVSYDPTEYPVYPPMDDQGVVRQVDTSAVSHNGQWEIMNVHNLGYVRVNRNDLSVAWIASFQSNYELTAISNDGRFVAVNSYATGPRPPTIYDLNNCGQSASKIQSGWFGTTLPNPCSGRDLTDTISAALGTSNFTIEAEPPDFSDDGWQISVTTRENPNGVKRVELNAAGYTPPRLDYLALGDSYSSGEGDIDRKPDGTNYYKLGTDYDGGCHVSERSYPFLLSSWMTIEPDRMESVACSGAKVDDMKFVGDSYLGQGDRLKSMTVEELAMSRSDAIDYFYPGRIEQIKFVQKYKPRAVTLTAGGNNVDFGGKLKACAKEPDICKWATSEGKAQLGFEIRNEFYELRDFYKELKSASPQTKIYAVGYPSFINPESWRFCLLDDGYLAASEKEMIDEATKYMNKTIKAAAQAAGVVYLDVEASLEGGRICDFGGEFITGQMDIFYSQQDADIVQTFHPNALGHQKITESIQNQLQGYTLLSYTYNQSEDNTIGPVVYPNYFNNEMTTYNEENGTRHQSFISTADTTKGQAYDIYTDQYTFEANSTIVAFAYSDPVEIGQLSADARGGVIGSLTIPTSLAAGYHDLELRGKSYSGEPIAIEQTILVKGIDPDDIDDNGTADILQPCGVFSPWSNTDVDLDGIDDACDLYTQNHRPIYRVRAGDLRRNYQGSSERTDFLYLERNVHAGSFTGVSNDYDQDGDGFTVIAATQASIPNGRYANPQTNTSIVPNTIYLSFRSAENGCVQYKPADPSQVTASSGYRTFTQQAVNTNSCRYQPITDDLDNNNQPDNTQPLYIGRNGDPSKGEIAMKLYLFRSTRAAEAQLGLSDYAPILSTTPSSIPVDDVNDYRQPWSLLATTQSNPTLAVTYKAIHIVGSVPYVVAKTNIGGLCQAYKPASTATIRQSTQGTINLTLDIQQSLNAQLGGWCNG